MARHPTGSRLLQVAIEHFGRSGLDGASTRAIARDAGTPMSAITYHYGGKDELYLAAADHISSTLAARVEPALAAATKLDLATNEGARAALQLIVARMIDVMVSAETVAFARFIVREQAEPTAAFERLYEGSMRHLLENIAGFLNTVSGGLLGAFDARLRAMTIVGQVLLFRVARATVLAGTGWTDIGPAEAAAIKAAIADNIEAICDRLEAGKHP